MEQQEQNLTIWDKHKHIIDLVLLGLEPDQVTDCRKRFNKTFNTEKEKD